MVQRFISYFWLCAIASLLHTRLITNRRQSKRYSRAGKRNDREVLLIHPDDARSRAIADGDIVRLFNDRGACLASAQLCPDLVRGVVSLPTGATFDPDARGTVIGLTLSHGPAEIFRATYEGIACGLRQILDLLEEGYVVIVGLDHPLASRSEVTLKELAEEPWATDDPLDSSWFERIAAGFCPSR